MIFEPGFSTKEVVTELSGRGVGMDVVKNNIDELGGKVQIESVKNKGSLFKIRLPLTLAIIDGGHVRVGFEDNTSISKGVLAKSNGELVEKVARLAKELGREIATPAEARKILGLTK